VGGLKNDSHALGGSALDHAIGDLGGEAFLHLGSVGKLVDDSGHLGQTDDFSVRQIGDVGLSFKGHEVVFAHGVEGDISQNDQFVIGFGKKSFEVSAGVEVQTAEQFGVHFCDTSWRFFEALAIGIFPNCGKNFANGVFNSVQINIFHGSSFNKESHPGTRAQSSVLDAKNFVSSVMIAVNGCTPTWLSLQRKMCPVAIPSGLARCNWQMGKFRLRAAKWLTHTVRIQFARSRFVNNLARGLEMCALICRNPCKNFFDFFTKKF